MDGLRERLMAALDNVYQDSYQPGHGLPCGDMADAVLAVRDEELAQLKRSRDGWRADAKREAGNAADHAAAIARVRAQCERWRYVANRRQARDEILSTLGGETK